MATETRALCRHVAGSGGGSGSAVPGQTGGQAEVHRSRAFVSASPAQTVLSLKDRSAGAMF